MDQLFTENQVIELLQKQNQLLTELYNLELSKRKEEKRSQYIHLFIQLIPFLILSLLMLWGYSVIMGAVHAVNQQYDFLSQGLYSIQTTLKSFVPDFSGVRDSFDSLKKGIGL